MKILCFVWCHTNLNAQCTMLLKEMLQMPQVLICINLYHQSVDSFLKYPKIYVRPVWACLDLIREYL